MVYLPLYGSTLDFLSRLKIQAHQNLVYNNQVYLALCDRIFLRVERKYSNLSQVKKHKNDVASLCKKSFKKFRKKTLVGRKKEDILPNLSARSIFSLLLLFSQFGTRLSPFPSQPLIYFPHSARKKRRP